jgi:hypothetical protein
MSEQLANSPRPGELDFQLLGTPRGDTEERRVCYRRRFFALQRIAPYDGSRIPDDDQFFCVESRDLTSQGASFLFPMRPSFRRLVIAFGEPPMRSYVVAEIIHSTDVMVYPSGLVEPAGEDEPAAGYEDIETDEGAPMVLVGCRFLQRQEAGEGSSALE